MNDLSPKASGGKARQASMTKEERSALAKAGAEARWASKRQSPPALQEAQPPEKETAPRPPAPHRPRRARRKGSFDHRAFSVALNAAERRLAVAIEERAKAANTWAVLNAEIPSLQMTIAALKNQQNPVPVMPSYGVMLPNGMPVGQQSGPGVSMDQIMSDAPISPATPRPMVQAGAVEFPVPELPYVPGRAGGRAMDTPAFPAVELDEDEHLNASAMAGRGWL